MGGQLWWAMCLSGNPPNFVFLLCYSSVVAMEYKLSLSFSLSLTIARAHALWCAVKHDSLTRDGSRFYVPSTSWPSTLVVSRLSCDQPMYQILEREKTKNLRWNSPETFFMRGLARTHLRSLQQSPRSLAEFKLLVSLALDPGPTP